VLLIERGGRPLIRVLSGASGIFHGQPIHRLFIRNNGCVL